MKPTLYAINSLRLNEWGNNGHNILKMDFLFFVSDASGLRNPGHVRDSQEKVVEALQQYTSAAYPASPSKFGELLLRIPELQRVCQVGKEMLCPRQPGSDEVATADGGGGQSFNLLMELLRGDHWRQWSIVFLRCAAVKPWDSAIEHTWSSECPACLWTVNQERSTSLCPLERLVSSPLSTDSTPTTTITSTDSL